MAGVERIENETWTCKCSDGVEVKLFADELLGHSSYFKALMQSQMEETKNKTLDLKLFRSDSVKLLLKICHLKSVSCNSEVIEFFKKSKDLDILEDVLKLIDYLDMACLYPKCTGLILELLPSVCQDIDIVGKISELCQTYGFEHVKGEMFKQIAHNVSSIKSKDPQFFCDIPGDVLSGVLAVPSIDVSLETCVVRLIIDWILYFKEERIIWFQELFRCVHVPSLTYSELTEVDGMVKELGLSDVNIFELFTSYKSNPHHFFISAPEQSEIRNGREVLMLLGGQYSHSLITHNQAFGSRQGQYVGSVPLLFQDLNEVFEQCLNGRCENRIEMSIPPTPSETKTASSENNGLYLKSLKTLNSPLQLVEFGLTCYENFVYIAGGQRRANNSAKFAVKQVRRMDPHTGEWSKIASMTEARCLFSVCCIWGRLYAVGGANQAGILKSTEYYVPEESQWYKGPDLFIELHEHAGCVFKDKLYISGGHSDTRHSNMVFMLEAKDGPWKPVASMLLARSYHGMVAVNDRMYVVGGCRNVDDEIIDLFSIEEYDIGTDSWTHVLNLNAPICCCLPVVINNQVLFVGGYSFNQKAYLQQAVSIDLANRQWKFSTLKVKKKVVGYMCLRLKLKQTILR